MILLALDASLTSTGYSILDEDNNVLGCGKITTKSKDKESYRIFTICNKCEELIKEYGVEKLIIEGQFVSRNKKTAMQLSRLYGSIMYISQMHGIEFISIEPSRVRSILLNDGCGDKEGISEYILEFHENNSIVTDIGPYSDKANKAKTSDIYDSISIGMAYLVGKEYGEEFKVI